MLIGFVYPSYASWKALESRKEGAAVATAGEAATQSRDAWLTYWVVFSAFNVVEHLLDWLVSWCVVRLATLAGAPGRCEVTHTFRCRSVVAAGSRSTSS